MLQPYLKDTSPWRTVLTVYKVTHVEIVNFGGSTRPLPTAKPLEMVGVEAPPRCPMGFAVGGGRLDFKNKRSPTRKLEVSFNQQVEGPGTSAASLVKGVLTGDLTPGGG